MTYGGSLNLFIRLSIRHILYDLSQISPQHLARPGLGDQVVALLGTYHPSKRRNAALLRANFALELCKQLAFVLRTERHHECEWEMAFHLI